MTVELHYKLHSKLLLVMRINNYGINDDNGWKEGSEEEEENE